LVSDLLEYEAYCLKLVKQDRNVASLGWLLFWRFLRELRRLLRRPLTGSAHAHNPMTMLADSAGDL
jgi:hypothetical protein